MGRTGVAITAGGDTLAIDPSTGRVLADREAQSQASSATREVDRFPAAQ